MDLLILEVGQGLAAAWTDAQFERALDGMSSEHNAAAAGEDGIAADDIMGQLLAARGMGMVRQPHRVQRTAMQHHRVWALEQKTVLERWPTPKLARRACSAPGMGYNHGEGNRRRKRP